MNELVAAAAVAAMSMDDEDKDDMQLEQTVGAVPAAEVLRPIDANEGGPLSPDPPSRFPSTARGAASSHNLAQYLTTFGSGRDRRGRAG